MNSILAAAEAVKAAVEADEAERYVRITQEELDALHAYQFTLPTSPSPGFVYKKEFWRIPGEKRWWTGSNEAMVRWAIGQHEAFYYGPLESFWQVYTCELDPADPNFVLHKPREAKIV